MTVADLRQILAGLPDDMPVICHQSEGGYVAYEDVSADVVTYRRDELFPYQKELAGKECLYIGGTI